MSRRGGLCYPWPSASPRPTDVHQLRTHIHVAMNIFSLQLPLFVDFPSCTSNAASMHMQHVGKPLYNIMRYLDSPRGDQQRPCSRNQQPRCSNHLLVSLTSAIILCLGWHRSMSSSNVNNSKGSARSSPHMWTCRISPRASCPSFQPFGWLHLRLKAVVVFVVCAAFVIDVDRICQQP